MARSFRVARLPCRDKEFKRNLQSAVVCWTLDVRTFGRSDVWTLDFKHWTLEIGIGHWNWTLDVGRLDVGVVTLNVRSWSLKV